MKLKEAQLEPATIGEHVRMRRLELRLTQREAARLLRVSASTVLNWEKGKTEVPIQAVPALIGFLAYNPFPAPRNLAERMLAKRHAMGWTIRQAAMEFGVDEGTWSAWESRRVNPWPRYEERLDAFLAQLPVPDLK